MGTLNTLTLLRTILYLWVAIEFSNLAYLYWYGYKTFKTTPIVRALQLMLTACSAVFFFLSFVPILLAVAPEFQAGFVNVVMIFLIPLGLALRRFREKSIYKETLKLPQKDDIQKDLTADSK